MPLTLLAAASGARTWSGVAAISHGTPPKLFAAGEFIYDKVPTVPSRLAPPLLVGRVAAGALVGATIGDVRDGIAPDQRSSADSSRSRAHTLPIECGGRSADVCRRWQPRSWKTRSSSAPLGRVRSCCAGVTTDVASGLPTAWLHQESTAPRARSATPAYRQSARERPVGDCPEW